MVGGLAYELTRNFAHFETTLTIILSKDRLCKQKTINRCKRKIIEENYETKERNSSKSCR